MKFHIHTLGCKTNLSDGLALTGRLLAGGHQRAADPADADLVVVNTCSVTQRADADARRFVSQVRRRNATARVVVTGCLAERDPEAVAAWAGVDEVVSNRDKGGFANRVGGSDGHGDDHGDGGGDGADGTLWDAPTSYPQFRDEGYTRAFLKVQDGCNAHCSFCVIPRTRGASRSLDPERVAESVRALGDSGAREVVLTGIHLGHYGRDLGTSLAELVGRLARLPRPGRLRLTSIEPNEVTTDLIARVAGSGRVAPHFHLPLQSGSDRILARMRRPYTARRYARVVEAIAARLPRGGIGADVIVGFPGETDADFARTVELVRSLPITYLHVFSYSSRPGTDAAAMPESVASEVIADRTRRLRAVGDELAARFLASLDGRPELALTLIGSAGAATTTGLTGAFVRVELPADLDLNELFPIRIRVDGGRALGDPSDWPLLLRQGSAPQEVLCPS